MIPRIIHYCWFGGKDIPPKAMRLINKCQKMNPDFKIMIWDESNFDISENIYAYEAHQCKKYAFLSDYARLKVLYDYGGIYMDTDVEVLKSLEPLLNEKGFTGFENDEYPITAVMGAEPKNKWIKLLLDDYKNRKFIIDEETLDLTTNTIRITELMKKNYSVALNGTYQEFEDFTLYPFDYFCVKNPHNKHVNITKNSFTIHWFDASWISFHSRMYSVIYKIFPPRFTHFTYMVYKKITRRFKCRKY